jgi:hypothetical protein
VLETDAELRADDAESEDGAVEVGNIGYSTPSSIILMEKVEKLDGLAA